MYMSEFEKLIKEVKKLNEKETYELIERITEKTTKLNKAQMYELIQILNSRIKCHSTSHEDENVIFKTTRNGDSFISRDMLAFSDNVLEIDYVLAKTPGQLHGTNAIKDLCLKNPTSIIVLKAEPVFDTHEEYMGCKDLRKRITRLKKFYKKLGFADINFFVDYECACGMLYLNEPGLAVYKKLKA
jgi:hypothetical protein